MAQQARLEKLLELIMLLNSTTGRTIDELMDRFLVNEKKVSTRTMYRYIDTIKQAGFIIDRDNGRYKLNNQRSQHDISKLLHFSEEEAFILSKAIQEVDGESEIKHKLAGKLYSLYDFNRVSRAITKKGDSENLLALIKAMKDGKQVILKDYQSANSKTISDRLVEPFSFTETYSSLWAFDTKDQRNKLFRTSRYSKVIVTDKRFQYRLKHEKTGTDIFRMAGTTAIPVQLKLTQRAYNLLIEEYPLAENKTEQLSNEEYLLNTKVYSFEGIGRFIMGLPGEIAIISPKKLKEYVKEKVMLF